MLPVAERQLTQLWAMDDYWVPQGRKPIFLESPKRHDPAKRDRALTQIYFGNKFNEQLMNHADYF
jgi:hypothetical protein